MPSSCERRDARGGRKERDVVVQGAAFRFSLDASLCDANNEPLQRVQGHRHRRRPSRDPAPPWLLRRGAFARETGESAREELRRRSARIRTLIESCKQSLSLNGGCSVRRSLFVEYSPSEYLRFFDL